MKKMSKRLLSVLLAVLMVVTAVPLSSLTVFADSKSDLKEQIDIYEGYITDLADKGIDGLYTNMYEAYKEYLLAVDTYENGSNAEMAAAATSLQTAISSMTKFEQKKATAQVKIGTSATVQPQLGSEKTLSYYTAEDKKINDYNSVIYSDGGNETASDWTNKATRAYFNYTYGWVDTKYYRNYLYFYYPNTVILYDGENTPAVPVIFGARGLADYNTDDICTSVLENIYTSADDVDLQSNYWVGTTCGNPFDTNYNYLYTVPSWPETDLTKLHGTSKDSLYYVSTDPGNYDTNYPEKESPYHLTDSQTKYQIFKNSLKYAPKDDSTNQSGFSVVKSTKWLGYSKIFWGTLGLYWRQGGSVPPAVHSKTKIYVVNYKYYLDSIKSFLSTNKTDFTADNAENGSLGNMLEALQEAAAFNPLDMTAYPYDNTTFTWTDDEGNEYTGMEAATRKCGARIDEIVDALGESEIEDVNEQIKNLDVAIEEYETKMAQQTVYTNMADAYEEYIIARKYSDSYHYGERRVFNPSLQTIAYLLSKKTKAMTAVGANSYNYYPNQAFDGDLSSEEKTEGYKTAYKNLVYASTAPTRERTNLKAPATDPATGTKVMRTTFETGYFAATDGSWISTFLYVPNAVGVYDGKSGEIWVPSLLGFMYEGGWIAVRHYGYLYTYYATDTSTTGLSFKYNWKTRTYVAGDAATYDNDNTDNRGSRTNAYSTSTSNPTPFRGKTFIETASLNQILNSDKTISSAPNGVPNSSTYASGTKKMNTSIVSNRREDNKAEAPNPENFYANVINVGNGNTISFTTTNSSKPWTKYYKRYSTIKTATVYGNNYSSYSQDGFFTSAHDTTPTLGVTPTGTYSGTGSATDLNIYVINYKPVQDIIDKNSGILTDSALDIKKYSEGGLETYFEDMDKLTACAPNNAKYEYDNDEYTNKVSGSTSTGYVAAVEQCAYDIYRLLEAGDEDEKVQELNATTAYDTAAHINKVNYYETSTNYSSLTKSYDKLRYALSLDYTSADSAIDPCAGDAPNGVSYWTNFINARNDGVDAMAQITDVTATDSEGVATAYEGYDLDTAADSEIIEKADAIVNAYDLLKNAPATKHTYKYNAEVGDTFEDNQFKHQFLCTKMTNHDADVAQMDEYNYLQQVYDTLDLTKYENTAHIESGKEAFDAVKTDEGSAGESAQEIVDQGISALLEGISAENGDDGRRIKKYNVTLKVVRINPDGSQDPVATDEVTYTNITYGTVISPDAGKLLTSTLGEELGSAAVFSGWEIQSSTGKRVNNEKTSQISLLVQSDATVIAYYTPTKAENQVSVTIRNVFGWTLYNLSVDKDTTIAITDLNTVKVGDTEYKVPHGLQQLITGWQVTGVEGNVTSLEAKTAGELAGTGSTVLLKPIAPYSSDSSVTYSITLDGEAYDTGVSPLIYDKFVTVTSPGAYAIAVKDGDNSYKVVAYGDSYSFYTNAALQDFYSVTYDGTKYEVDGQEISKSQNSDLYFYINEKRPMIYSYADYINQGTQYFSTRSLYTMNAGEGLDDFTITECGTLYVVNDDNATDAKMRIENVNNGVKQYINTASQDYLKISHQFSFEPNNSKRLHLSTRGYVKYQYTLNKGTANETVISAIAYSEICQAYDSTWS